MEKLMKGEDLEFLAESMPDKRNDGRTSMLFKKNQRNKQKEVSI